MGPDALDDEAETLASRRAASLRALFPAGARVPTPPPPPPPPVPVAAEPAPAPAPPRRRRWVVVTAVAAAAVVAAAAGAPALRGSDPAPAGSPAAPELAAPVPDAPSPSAESATAEPSPSAVPSTPAAASPSRPPSPSGVTPSPGAAPPPVGKANPARANLALDRPVTASGVEGHAWPPESVVDGRLDTRWASAFEDSQWLQVDLGQLWTVSQVRLAWEHAYAKRYAVALSQDGRTWTEVYATSAGSGGTVDIDAGGVPARYVKLVCTRRSGSYGYSLFEVEVR